MKIVHCCLVGPMTDGLNYQENKLTKFHKRIGHEVTIIASKWIWKNDGTMSLCDKSEYFNEDGVKVIRLPLLFGTVNTRLKLYRRLFHKVAAESPDILFIHGLQFLNIITLAKYAKSHRNVAVYVDNHADFSNSASNWASKFIQHKIIWKFCGKRIEPYVRKFYGVLPARVDFLVDMYGLPKNKCQLLVMGVDDDFAEAARQAKVRSAVRRKYNILQGDFFVVSGGKIDSSKWQTLLLIDAIKRLKRNNVKLIVFGSVAEDLQADVQNLSDGKIVQYIGWIDPDETYALFAAADLAVFPGRHSVFWEEVAGLGVPMLVKDWEGTHHIDLGGNVDYLTQDSSDEMQEKIGGIVDSPETYQKMKLAAEAGRKTFSYKRIAEESIERV